MKVSVIGAGLAGCEAAWQLAKRGFFVDLYEMKPEKRSPAHHSDGLAEIVCSNSLKSNEITNACGLLKQELRLTGSMLMNVADCVKVGAGAALAVDREEFSVCVTTAIKAHPRIKIISGVVDKLPEGDVIIATGPLTDEALMPDIEKLCGGRGLLHFFDAAAPIVTAESVDTDSAFFAARYDKGEADYLNCPMNKEEYDVFYDALVTAETAEVKDFETADVFEGCMPVEVMAKRGRDTLRFGPLKPVGLTDKRTGRRNYAVLQLRKENNFGNLYNLVGFQTHLTFGEQKRVFGLIPALKNAEFVRYGVMHRNTFVCAPEVLTANYRVKSVANRRIYIAGQLSGVEGYVESIASGMVAALDLYIDCLGGRLTLDAKTMTGALGNYISSASPDNFQPMNSNFAITEPLDTTVRDKNLRKRAYAERALKVMEELRRELGTIDE